MLPSTSSMTAAMPTRILGEVKLTMQACVVILVTVLVTMTDLVAALAMTTTMGLAMAVMMTMLAAVPVATVRGSARRKAVVAIIVAKEAGQILQHGAGVLNADRNYWKKRWAHAVKRCGCTCHDFKALWRVWGSFGSGGASALAELLLKRPTELIFCVQTRAFRITRGRLSGQGK